MTRTGVALAVVALALSAPPARAGTLFGLLDTGELFASADQGVSWTIRSTLPVRDAVSLAARGSASELFLASQSGSIYRSLDAGVSWAAVGVVPASNVAELAIEPDGDLLLLAASGGLYRSADQGASWEALASLVAPDFVSLAVAAGDDLYAVTRTGSVYRSQDGGGSWFPLGLLAVSNAARLRTSGNDLFVVTETGEFYESVDGGTTWNAIAALSQIGIRGFVATGDGFYVATKEGHVATSPDGAAWSWQGSINQLSLTALADDTPAVTAVGGPAVAVRFSGPIPNPSRGARARFSLHLDRSRTAYLSAYDVRGRRVARSAPVTLQPGAQDLQWEPDGVRTGAYRIRLSETSGAVLGEVSWIIVR